MDVKTLLTNDWCIWIPWAFGFVFQRKNCSLALQPTFFKVKQIFYFKTNFLIRIFLWFYQLRQTHSPFLKTKIQSQKNRDPLAIWTTPLISFPKTHSTHPTPPHCSRDNQTPALFSGGFPLLRCRPHQSEEQQVQANQPEKQVNSETQRLPVEPETTPVTRTTDWQHTSRPSPITQYPQSPFPSSSLYPIPISGREPLLHQTDQARYQKFSPQLGQRPPSGSGVMPVSRNPDDRPETKEQNAHPTKTN